MNSTKWMRGALAAAAIMAAVPALADDAAKATFQARYAELRTAMQAHDEAAMGTLMTPDYVMTDIQGATHTRADMAQMGARMGGRPGGPRPDAAKPAQPPKDGPRPERKVEQTVLAATVTGDTAKVDQQLKMSGQREGEDGEAHTMEMTSLTTDTWVRQNGVWLLKTSVQKDMSVARDGDVVFHQAK